MSDDIKSSKEAKAALARAVTRAQNADEALDVAQKEKRAADSHVRDCLRTHAAAVEAETKAALGWVPAPTRGRAGARADTQAPTPTPAHTHEDTATHQDPGELTDGERLGNGQVLA